MPEDLDGSPLVSQLSGRPGARDERPGRVGRLLGTPATAPAVTLLCLGAAFLVAGEYLNPDGAAYLSLAEQWAAGNWGQAVSGYWGPAYSWLLAPLVLLGIEPIAATFLVLAVAAVAAVWVVRRILDRLGVSPALAGVGALAAAPILVWSAAFGAYPETLLILALLSYALLLGDPYEGAPTRYVAAGVVGGTAFLCKAVALPLVVGHILVLLAWALGTGRATAARRLGLALAGVVVVAGPWIAVLTVSYDQLTFSTAVGFNDDLVGSRGNPLLYAGLYELPFPEARSAWDDPTRTIDPDLWPLPAGDVRPSTAETSRLDRLTSSLRVAIGSLGRRAGVASALALVSVTVLAWRRRLSGMLASLALLGAAAFVGYVGVLVIERYLWFTMVVVVIVAAVGLDAAPARLRGVPVGLAALTLLLSGWLGAGLAMTTRLGDHQRLDQIVADNPQLTGARVAGYDSWEETLAICVRADCSYLGKVGEVGLIDQEDLRRFGVDYVVDPTAPSPEDQVRRMPARGR